MKTNMVLGHEEFCDAFMVACDAIHRELHLHEHGTMCEDTPVQAMFSQPARDIALAVLTALGIGMDEDGCRQIHANAEAARNNWRRRQSWAASR